MAAVESARSRVQSLRAQFDQTRSQVNQGRAVLVHTQDVLHKTTYTSPINGIVSYLPERVGDFVVPGMQNANGSFIMTLSDMSVVTAEVKVDETDIVNVKMGQEADVTIDAVPGKIFKGKVTEIGSQAVLRSSGLTTTQTTTSTQPATRSIDDRQDQNGGTEKRRGDSDSGAGSADAQGFGRSGQKCKETG